MKNSTGSLTSRISEELDQIRLLLEKGSMIQRKHVSLLFDLVTNGFVTKNDMETL